MKALVLALCLVAAPVFAQVGPDQWARDHLRLKDHRQAVDKASTILVGAALALPCLFDRTWRCVANEGLQVGAVLVSTQIAKVAVDRARPNGYDEHSFWSMHTALACVAVIRTKAWAVCPAVGYMRVASDWHWATDTMVGAGAGAVMTTIRWGKE